MSCLRHITAVQPLAKTWQRRERLQCAVETRHLLRAGPDSCAPGEPRPYAPAPTAAATSSVTREWFTKNAALARRPRQAARSGRRCPRHRRRTPPSRSSLSSSGRPSRRPAPGPSPRSRSRASCPARSLGAGAARRRGLRDPVRKYEDLTLSKLALPRKISHLRYRAGSQPTLSSSATSKQQRGLATRLQCSLAGIPANSEIRASAMRHTSG